MVAMAGRRVMLPVLPVRAAQDISKVWRYITE
jgi:hypothetical protein